MRNSCMSNVYICNILFYSFWKMGRMFEVEELLRKMNEKGYGLDIVICNIIVDGFCGSGELDKVIEIVKGMRVYGSVVFGNLGNLYVGLVDDSMIENNCLFDLIIYLILFNGLCKVGRFVEVKKLFVEMMGEKL